MSRQAVIIPAAGKELRINMTGRSVIVEAGSIYDGPADVPFLSFDSGSVRKPIYPQSTYNNNCDKFSSVVLIGTEASAGDEFYIYSTDDYLKEDIQIQYNSRYKTAPGTTFSKLASDANQTLSALELENAAGKMPVKLYVSVSSIDAAQIGGITYAFNTAPAQGANALGGTIRGPAIDNRSVEGGGFVFEIEDESWMLAFNFKAEVAGESPRVNFTPEY